MDATADTNRRNMSGRTRLKIVNFEIEENHSRHETEGLSSKRLVVRRGRAFKVTLMFDGRLWEPSDRRLMLQVSLGDMSAKMLVNFSEKWFDTDGWSARVYPGDLRRRSVTVQVFAPVRSSVGLYRMLVHIDGEQERHSFLAGTFVLLCNPWLEEDPVYMPPGVLLDEYVRRDYGVVYMGTDVNVVQRPWSFGQYEPGVLEACLQLLQVSPQHLSNKHKDYVLRADPVYLSRVMCAMVNSSDDMGVLEGKWQGNYMDGVGPTEWSGSADILHRWFASKGQPVRYGQCWVFASVLCTVMRVLGIPSRVVTVFNAAHDSDGNLIADEFYSSTGEKLSLSKDSIWNFHVWVECWMRRPDLGLGFDGWQVVDPTPQEKSAGMYRCGPCPVAAIRGRCLSTPYDAAFLYASVDADIVRMIVRSGRLVSKTTDTRWVGRSIFTKSVGSDAAEDLTESYKKPEGHQLMGHQLLGHQLLGKFTFQSARLSDPSHLPANAGAVYCTQSGTMPSPAEADGSSLDVSLAVDGEPTAGESIDLTVTLTNKSERHRVLLEHLNAQLKEFNRSPQKSFWKSHKEVSVPPFQVVTLQHSIPPSEYESFLSDDDIVKVSVVIKDVKTKERVLATQDFNISTPKINIQVESGDIIKMKKEHTAVVSFTNKFNKGLSSAVLALEGYGLLQRRQEVRLSVLQPGEKMEKRVSIMASTKGTKLLAATLSHGNSSKVLSRSFHKVSVTS
ncbi:protein-glutamine gamma-glutamyltransferase 5-like isoform X4 [Nerophis ophidion]|uniref:protein-glutamine gamma-glutamyltransferase 5-like isoform X2 n=1 Tax=Nerophis ophidion TaxID=159077 RepID=UPI002AE01BAF|nr:protein-glutamine gamma-glutamyltransferase 5-like isoform X2 [Nerophis ophidion]XP_061758737.1 protein-glutamine gamma-glutamyltransferase 5-like isoform X3 [Nerophis ophidion]XP_061758738.1 protein-glutamine gamma-glutamyltransferase 5-like isoform X4 [Nerophis ophidion]